MSYIGSSDFVFYEKQFKAALEKIQAEQKENMKKIEAELEKRKIPSVSNSTLHL